MSNGFSCVRASAVARSIGPHAEGDALGTGHDYIAALAPVTGSSRSSVPQFQSLRAIHSPPPPIAAPWKDAAPAWEAQLDAKLSQYPLSRLLPAASQRIY
jgi:hypothetical protein